MTVLPDKSDPEQSAESQAERCYRMRHEWSNLIEDLIAEGREKGVFDNLKGQGKPLNLKQNPYAPELDLAHNLLKDNELVPAWIGDRNNLLQRIQTLRQEIQRVWQQNKREFDLIPARQDTVAIRWYDACLAWEKVITDLNKQILNYNLKRPADNLEIYQLELDRELKRLGATRWLR